MSIDVNLTWSGKLINDISESITPWLGSLTGEIFGGMIIAIVTIIVTMDIKGKARKILNKIFPPKIYFLMPTETNYNREHLAHQINAFKIFLNEDVNQNMKNIKFVMVKEDAEEIHEFLKNIITKKVILVTSMSFVFNQTLKELVKLNKNSDIKINANIKVIGTLGSRSKELQNIDQPSNIIRIFPPDYDEAKIAYEFFYHKLLSYFCNNKNCEHSYLSGKVEQAKVTVYHSQSYGSALNEWFEKYYNDNKKEGKYNSFGEQNTEDFISLYSCDYDDDELNLSIKACFHFIFIVGYEPNISGMVKNIFKEFQTKKLDSNKLCILFSPTVEVEEWRKKICKTIIETSKSMNIKIDTNRFFYLKSKIPTDDFTFTEDQQKSNAEDIKLNFYKYNLENKELSKSLEDVFSKLTFTPNYINAFTYTSLKMAKLVKKNWHESLHDLKREAFVLVLGNKKISKPKIYDNGDSIEHFIVRPFFCDNHDLEISVEKENNTVVNRKRKGKRK